MTASMTALSLLEDTEYYLRRQLQLPAEDDPNMTTTTETESPGNVDGDSQSRGRAILTILYLCILALCFIVPVFYYFRLHCSEESARRELEVDFTNALEQSTQQQQHRDENRAARRKYLEQRRALLVQLFGPVRMILKEENFPHLAPLPDGQEGETIVDNYGESIILPAGKCDETVTMASEGDYALSPYTSEEEEEEGGGGDISDGLGADNGESQTRTIKEQEEDRETDEMEQGIGHLNRTDDSVNDYEKGEEEKEKDPEGEEEPVLVRLPKPGLQLGSNSLFADPTKILDGIEDRELRVCQGLCSICLCNYKVGSDVVWSSNEACDHHFHASCIEKWLMKQREGPLCPCCRRDFIVDPFDMLENEDNNNDNGDAPVLQWDPSTFEEDYSGLNFDPVVAATGENNDNSHSSNAASDDPNTNNNTENATGQAEASSGQSETLEPGAEASSDTYNTYNNNSSGSNDQPNANRIYSA